MSVHGVQAHELDTVWPKVNHLVARALEYDDGKMSLDDVYGELRAQNYQLWLVPGGVWLTRIVVYPQSKRAEFVAAAGTWDDWRDHADIIIAWAKAHHCDAIEIIGRPGWGRKSGLEEIHRTFRMRI